MYQEPSASALGGNLKLAVVVVVVGIIGVGVRIVVDVVVPSGEIGVVSC